MLLLSDSPFLRSCLVSRSSWKSQAQMSPSPTLLRGRMEQPFSAIWFLWNVIVCPSSTLCVLQKFPHRSICSHWILTSRKKNKILFATEITHFLSRMETMSQNKPLLPLHCFLRYLSQWQEGDGRRKRKTKP